MRTAGVFENPVTTHSAAVRASAVKDTLAFLDRFEPGAQQRVLARIPAPVQVRIHDTPRSGWVSLDDDHYSVDAIVELFGDTRAVQFWQASVMNLIERPLLKTFVSGMMRVLGNDPGRIIGLIPKGWSLVYRDLCRPVLDASREDAPAILFEQVAPDVRKYSNYFHCWHGACAGFAQLSQIKSPVRFTIAGDKSSAEAVFGTNTYVHQGSTTP
jgi:hypothetical protein